MTPEQLVTFGTAIRANTDQGIIDAIAAGNNTYIRNWYNQLASPDVWVLQQDVSVDDIVGVIDWATDYAAFKDDMTAVQFLLSNGTYDPRTPNARAALNEVFSGAANTKAAILVLATRKATYAEGLFIEETTGPGGGDGSVQGQSAIATWVGEVTNVDVREALLATAT